MPGQTSADDELATLYLPRVENKTVPPPPAPVRSAPPQPSLPQSLPPPPALPQPISVVVPRSASGMPLAFSKATLVIELRMSDLDDAELAQITTWLEARSAHVAVRDNGLARRASTVVEFARTIAARLRAAAQDALVWTLSRVDRLASGKAADASGTLARPVSSVRPVGSVRPATSVRPADAPVDAGGPPADGPRVD